MVHGNMIQNCPISAGDSSNAYKMFGTDFEQIKE